jgi:hypothetical protein
MFYRVLMLLFLFGLSAARANDVTVGSTKLAIPHQPGLCDLDESKAGDKRMIVAIRGMIGTNTLLSMSADCGQLRTWHAKSGILLQNMLQYQTMSSWLDKAVTSEDIKGACDTVAAEGDKLTSEQLPDVRSRAETFMKKVDIQGNQFLGVLENKPGEVCFSAMLQRYKAETGAQIVQLNVWATTRIREKLVYVYYFSPYVDSGTITVALANLKIYYANLVEANR